jgi:polyferredoxin
MKTQPLPLDLNAPGKRFDLTRIALLKRLVKSRGFQFWLLLPGLFGFVLVILTGLFGTPVGSANFSIIFVWIVWWAVLIMLLIPLGGRAWCAMCPIPAPGEWLQRRALINKGIEKPLAFVTKRWPRRFKNIWLQNAAFLGVALFSAVILTRPLVTALVLLLFIGAALALHLAYGRRVFCRYVCPVGGFVGLYAMVAPLEIRVKDAQVCLTHKEKECLRGSGNAYGCPWLEYPGTMVRNTYCGMCTECLKACPKDNIGINLRPFGQDLLVAGQRRLDEAYKAFIMLTCAGVYSAVMMGPWGWLKDWANLSSLPGFVAYALLFLAANLLVVPGLFYLAAWLGRRLALPRSGEVALPAADRLVVDFAYALIPMGLAAWIAFSLAFVLVNGSYAVPLLSDPFGWGWNLIGTAGYPWTPYVTGLLPYLQAPVLLGGLAVAIIYAHKIARQVIPARAAAFAATVPVAAFLTGATLVFLRLYLG